MSRAADVHGPYTSVRWLGVHDQNESPQRHVGAGASRRACVCGCASAPRRSACWHRASPPRANRPTRPRQARRSSSLKTGGSGLRFSIPNGGLLANGTEILSVSASGALTPVGGSPPDPSATSVAFSPSGAFLAAANESSDSISIFSVSPSGALTAVPASPFTLGAKPASVVFSPNGELLEVSAGESVYVSRWASSGALTRGSRFALRGERRQPRGVQSGGQPARAAGFRRGEHLLGRRVGRAHGRTRVSIWRLRRDRRDTRYSVGGNTLRVAGWGRAGGAGEVVTSYSVASSGVPTSDRQRPLSRSLRRTGTGSPSAPTAAEFVTLLDTTTR